MPGEAGSPIPCLAYNTESGLGRIVAAAPRLVKAKVLLEPVFTSHLAAVLRAVALEGRGISWLPYSLIAQDLERGALVRAADETWDIGMEIRLFRSSERLARVAEQFWRLLDRQAGTES